MLRKRDEGGMVRPSPEEGHLDGLAMGMADGSISRGRAIKLAGAALVGGALTLFGATQEADAAVTGRQRRRCRRKYTDADTGQRFGVICTGRGRTVCCDDRCTTARQCSAGRCGGVENASGMCV
jgi:hypothetical protein